MTPKGHVGLGERTRMGSPNLAAAVAAGLASTDPSRTVD